MSTNGFREDELVTRKVKINGDWQTRIFPVVGGRLRLAHEQNDSLSLQTEMVSWDGQYAVFKCFAATGKGQFVGYGTANSQRDTRLAESLVELAETRSIARALRFAGFGLEFTGAEEVSHVSSIESEPEQTAGKESKPVFPKNNGSGKTEAQGCAMGEPESKPSRDGNGNGKATGAQIRALFALSKKARYIEQDVANMLRPMNVSTFDALTREDASRLISYLQIQTAQ
ncbi:MAG: hypothetical protein ACLQPD_04870 [Desulfomonilaceae bacterium]